MRWFLQRLGDEGTDQVSEDPALRFASLYELQTLSSKKGLWGELAKIILRKIIPQDT